MSKNIVVLTGSPRKNGNSIAMTDAFINAAQKRDIGLLDLILHQ